MSADAFNRELAEQIHATATIASTKHRHVQRAIVYAVTSVPLGLLAHVLSLQF
jgi:hypothetical protein